jgi:hypothetical protein
MPSYGWILGAGIACLMPLALLVEVRRWIELGKERAAADKALPLRRAGD